jgi:hypothetical protein
MRNKKWQSVVYKKSELPFGKDFDEYWNRIKVAVFDRDHSRCQGCLKRKKSLSVHHIIPRKCGGADDLDNLITLCIECHNLVEDMSFRSREEIYGFNTASERAKYDSEKKKAEKRKHSDFMSELDRSRPSWHKKVYGSGGK